MRADLAPDPVSYSEHGHSHTEADARPSLGVKAGASRQPVKQRCDFDTDQFTWKPRGVRCQIRLGNTRVVLMGNNIRNLLCLEVSENRKAKPRGSRFRAQLNPSSVYQCCSPNKPGSGERKSCQKSARRCQEQNNTFFLAFSLVRGQYNTFCGHFHASPHREGLKRAQHLQVLPKEAAW